MLQMQNAPNRARPVATEYHAVIDESGRRQDCLGTAMRVFPSLQRAQRYEAKVREACRMLRRGTNPRLAFHPSIRIDDIIQDCNGGDVRPRIVQLNRDLPKGAVVDPRLHCMHLTGTYL